jgi:sugar phosphate isomerase/epimerase
MMKLSVQIYSLREAGDLDTQLALARAAGFKWIESVASHGLPPDEFAAKVAAHGLRVSSMHVSLAMVEQELPRVIETCHATDCRLAIMPWLPMGERPATAIGWQALGARLAKVGDTLNAEGLRLAYHNHEFEFLQYSGRTALDWIFSTASAQQLGWEADLGWVARAGLDPMAAIEPYADRLVAIHTKDIAPPGMAADEDGWCALGQGIVPWPALLADLQKRVSLFVLEHDKPKDHAAMLKTSFDFMHQQLIAN